jgi:hypothetical protein
LPKAADLENRALMGCRPYGELKLTNQKWVRDIRAALSALILGYGRPFY